MLQQYRKDPDRDRCLRHRKHQSRLRRRRSEIWCSIVDFDKKDSQDTRTHDIIQNETKHTKTFGFSFVLVHWSRMITMDRSFFNAPQRAVPSVVRLYGFFKGRDAPSHVKRDGETPCCAPSRPLCWRKNVHLNTPQRHAKLAGNLEEPQRWT